VIIDAHQHFWDLESGSYPWLTAAYGPIYRSFDEAQLEPELRSCGVSGTVLFQSMDSYEDSDAMFAVAQRWRYVMGVVAWAPLTRAEESAKAIERFRRHDAFVGVRHRIHEEPDPDWLLRDDLQRGLELLEANGFTFDVVAVLPRHLDHVATLAERFPRLKLVVDHTAKPPIKDGGWLPWAELMTRAASYPNVYTKLSGLNTAANWETWGPDDLRPYVDHALGAFGANRVMFGSDWPVSILAGGYQKVWAATQSLLSGLTEDERAMVLGATASEFYGLEVRTSSTS
jgi:L-fuconolactonase